jgi:hypothetical protein
MLLFLAGFIVGVFALGIFAVQYNRLTRPKAEDKRTISALGAGGHAITMDSYQAKLMRDVIRHYEAEA